MSDVLPSSVTDMAEYRRRYRDPSLKSGGGSGTSDGMEGRVAKLEAHMEIVRTDVGLIKNDVREVRDRLGKLEVKVDHLPSKGFVVKATLTALSFLAAITLFQAKLQGFLGILK